MTGTVRVRFTVLTTGRIANCRVVGSSGSNVLDDVTCRLLTQRLRFRPATDGSGRPIESELGSDYTWGINIRR
jgi:protein TonB